MTDVRVHAGDPTPEDLAVIITLLRSRGGAQDFATPTSWWRQPILRTPIHPQPGAWRHSLR